MGRKLLILAVFVAMVPLAFLTEAATRGDYRLDSPNQEVLVLDDTLFSSNQYTQIDDTSVVNNYLDIPDTFIQVGESDALILYMEEDSYAIRIVNKADGFIYGSSLMSKNDDLEHFGSTWEGYVNSAVTIKYYSLNPTTGLYTTIDESLFTDRSTTTSYSLIDNGFEATLHYGKSGIGLTLRVYLDADQLKVEVPKEGITEGDTFKLRSIRIFPFFGAVYSDSIPGYIFVPDGSGALIRYQPIDYNTEIYEFPYYGLDLGIRAENPNEAQLLLPVTGMVLGIDQHGFMTMIDDGEMFASFVVSPAKNNLKYYYSYNEFLYRSLYQTPTNQSQATSGSGRLVIQEDTNSCNVAMTYRFLAGNEANYVGMANIYRDYLVSEGELVPNIDQLSDIPLFIELIGAELKTGFIFDQTEAMTTVKQAETIIAELSGYVDSLTVVMEGFFKGGFSSSGLINHNYLGRLGTEAEFRRLIEKYRDTLVELYFYVDVMKVYDNANYSVYKDIAQKINQNLLQLHGQTKNYYYIRPQRIASAFTDNEKSLGKLGIDSLALGTIGNHLYSDYSDKLAPIDRQMAIDIYREAFSGYEGKLLLYRPNLYLLKYAEKYLMTPMTSSNYRIYTDTVPFMAIFLHGTIDAFAPFANFNANQTHTLLQMVDYGLYPSYILTDQSAYQLQDTELRQIYSSSYEVWKNVIASDYEFLNEALSQVYDSRMVDREAVDIGVYRDTYANGTIIYVNYTSQPYQEMGHVVMASSYLVVIGNG